MSRERQLARLFRALIACCAFLFAAEAPLLPAWSARDASGWVAERSPVPPAAPRAPGARPSRSRAAAPRTASRMAASRDATSRMADSRVGDSRTAISHALASRAAAGTAAAETNVSRLDRRYLFLEIQTLLC